MTDKELVLQVLQDYSRDKAMALQTEQVNMTGTELYAQEQYIPDFQAAKAAMNMMGKEVGPLRMPMTEIEDAHREVLRKAMTDFGLL